MSGCSMTEGRGPQAEGGGAALVLLAIALAFAVLALSGCATEQPKNTECFQPMIIGGCLVPF